MKVLVCGSNGHMGKILTDMIKKDKELEFICGIDRNVDNNTETMCYNSFNEVKDNIDIIVDFSHHSLTKELIDFAINKNLPVVIATTGQDEEEKKYIKDKSKKIPVFYAANYSMGIAVLINEAKNIAKVFDNADIEIIETHHNRKLDAPSGTALAIGNALKEVRKNANLICGRNGNKKREKEDIGINSIRLGNIVGIHEVMISTNYESITIKHEAYDRGLFAEGAIKAMKFIIDKPKGLYNMNDILKF